MRVEIKRYQINKLCVNNILTGCGIWRIATTNENRNLGSLHYVSELNQEIFPIPVKYSLMQMLQTNLWEKYAMFNNHLSSRMYILQQLSDLVLDCPLQLNEIFVHRKNTVQTSEPLVDRDVKSSSMRVGCHYIF